MIHIKLYRGILMKRAVYKRIVEGFTVGKKELNENVIRFKKEFYEQNHCQDAIKFIADRLDSIGFIDNASSVGICKYTLVDRYLVSVDLVQHLRDSYRREHAKPNPNFSYDNNGPRDLEEYYYCHC